MKVEVCQKILAERIPQHQLQLKQPMTVQQHNFRILVRVALIL